MAEVSVIDAHREEHDYHPDPKTRQSTSQTVVSYSTSPMARDDMITTTLSSPPCSSTSATRGKDDCNRDPPGLSNEHPEFVGVTSAEFERCERYFPSERTDSSRFTIPPLLKMTFKGPELPNGWVAFHHPDGALYFFNNSWEIAILTDVRPGMYHVESREKLETIITKIFSYIRKYKIEIPEESCLVLEFRPENTRRCGYYFVNHAEQRLFWLDEYNGMDFLFEIKADSEYTPSESLIGHEMKSLYWRHNHLFPNICPFPSDAIPEIKDVLIHALGESLTSDHDGRSLVSNKSDVLQKMLDLVDKIHEQDKPLAAAGSIATISRFLHNFYHERFLYGQRMDRLNENQSILPSPERQLEKTLPLRIVSPLLFYGIEAHLRNLQEITADSVINEVLWKQMLSRITDEWRDFIIYATVLLNANVAFLAIQSVDSTGSMGHRSNAQIASYISVADSVGAIVFGLHLVREHNVSSNSVHFLRRNRLETTALVYAVPYALLMWGMVCFLVAFSFMCFSTCDEIVIVLFSFTLISTFSLFLWWISVLYEGRSCSESHHGLYMRFKNSVKKWFMVQSANMRSADNDN